VRLGLLRRDALKQLTAAPLAAGLAWTAAEAHTARKRANVARRETVAAQTTYAPQFFTADEYATLSALVEMILPADDRSGGAADAGVPEFIDFMMIDQPTRQDTLRGGLAWLDVECQRRFDRRFTVCDAVQRGAVLDDIAWPDRAPASLSQGVGFFSNVRDLTATGFWTSQIGIEDLQYLGNRYRVAWRGCPPDALDRLGVRYDD
jgi:hypothetical protein